jgi:hypothetical protein
MSKPIGSNLFPDFDLIPAGRDTFDYVEGDHVMAVYAERMAKEFDRFIGPASIKRWKPPFENEPVTEDVRKRVLERICKYFDAAKITYRIG